MLQAWRIAALVAVISSLVFQSVLESRTLAATQTQPPSTPAQEVDTPRGPEITDCSEERSRSDTESATLPASANDLLKLLVMCREKAQMLIADGRFGYVFLPAMEAKDVALALEEKQSGGLGAQGRPNADSAVWRLVTAAWRLDADGDMGNKERLTESYNLFAAAVAEILSAFGVP